MKADLIPTAISIRDMNCFNLDSISSRIILQKKVYLAQYFGLNLGYSYNWYIHGPYSPSLTANAYEIIPLGLKAFSQYDFTDTGIKLILDKVNKLGNENEFFDLDESSWYELLASIAFLKKRGYDYSSINDRLKNDKPQFSKEQVEKAYGLL